MNWGFLNLIKAQPCQLIFLARERYEAIFLTEFLTSYLILTTVYLHLRYNISTLMTLNGNWVDVIIVVFIAVYILGKLQKGFLQGLVDLAGFLFSLIFALKFYYVAANLLIRQFDLPHGIANALGFFIMAFLGELLLFALSIFLFKFIHPKILDSKLNKSLSFIPAAISGLVLVAFFLTAVLVLPVRPNIKQAVASSRIGNYLTSQTMGLERSINKVFGGAVQEALAFMTVKPESDQTVNLNFQTTAFQPDPASEREMLRLLNAERVKEGLETLAADEPMRQVARAHCADMFTYGYFSHYTPNGLSPFDRMDHAGVEYRAAGENLAYAPNVEIAHQGLMDSPGHRANILSDKYGRVGIGVMDAGIYGKMFCQEFRD